MQRTQLGSHVLGQEDAVESISTALCRARCGLKDPRRPVASLLFVGPTGAVERCSTFRVGRPSRLGRAISSTTDTSQDEAGPSFLVYSLP